MNEIFAQALKPFAPKVATMEFCQECCSTQECEARGGCVGPAGVKLEIRERAIALISDIRERNIRRDVFEMSLTDAVDQLLAFASSIQPSR